MKQLTDFSRIHFGVLPTPLYKLENLSREFGKNIYIKRDDMIGVALGGNKVRKLEYLLADARDQGVDVVLTAGGPVQPRYAHRRLRLPDRHESHPGAEKAGRDHRRQSDSG